MRYGRVIAVLGIETPQDAALLKRAIERELREAMSDDPRRERLTDYRLQLAAMPRRAALEEWGGWE